MKLLISASRLISTGLTEEENMLERKPFSTVVALTVARNNSSFRGASSSCCLCSFSASVTTGEVGSELPELEESEAGGSAEMVTGTTADAGVMTIVAEGTALSSAACADTVSMGILNKR